jgi:hypothetical protein
MNMVIMINTLEIIRLLKKKNIILMMMEELYGKENFMNLRKNILLL